MSVQAKAGLGILFLACRRRTAQPSFLQRLAIWRR